MRTPTSVLIERLCKLVTERLGYVPMADELATRAEPLRKLYSKCRMKHAVVYREIEALELPPQ